MALILDNITYGGLFSTSDTQPYNWFSLTEVARDVATQWLTDEEITETLNLYGDTSQEALLTSLDLAARMFVEDQLGRSIFARTFLTTYRSAVFQAPYSSLDLPNATNGTTTVNFVQYYSEALPPAIVNLPATSFFYDPTGSKVVLLQDLSSIVSNYVTAPIQVTFTVDVDLIATYPNVRRAGLLYLTHLYNNRAGTTIEPLKYIPAGIDTLLTPYKPLVM